MNTFYVSDLDGTLLADDATLSDFSRNALTTLLEEGLVFTVATARSVHSARAMLDGLRLTLPIIEFNGAFISDLATGRHEIVHHMESPLVEEILDLTRRFHCAPFISSFNGVEDCLYYNEIANDGMLCYLQDLRSRKDARLRFIEDLARACLDQVVCVTIIGETTLLSDVESAIREAYGEAVILHHYEHRYSPGWYWLTVHDRRATKDHGLQILRERYGLRDRRLVVFGDHDNDIPMFRIADCAVAVANATEELKRHATRVIGSNQEDSVLRFLLNELRAGL